MGRTRDPDLPSSSTVTIRYSPPKNDKHHHEQRRPKNQPKTHLDTEHSSRAPSRTTASPAPSPNRAIGHQLRPQPPLRPRPRQPGASYTAFPYLQLLQPGQNVPRLPSAYPDYSVMFPSLLTYCSTAVHPLTHCRVRLVVTARLRNGRLHISLHMSPFPFRRLDSTRRRSTSAGDSLDAGQFRHTCRPFHCWRRV